MKKYEQEALSSRRHFLRQSACASLGATGLVNALAQMRLMAASMSASETSGDYKALVCLFLAGGNDSYNMLIPIGDPQSDGARADYEAARGVLAIARNEAKVLNVPGADPDVPTKAFNRHYGDIYPAMGVHPNAQPMADLFNTGELAFLCNVGSLAYPIPSRDDYLNQSVGLPKHLFSHANQASQWQSSIADKPFSTGWGGRVADLLDSSYNPTSKVSMSVTVGGVSSFQMGTAGGVTQYMLKPSGGISLEGYGTQYSSAYHTAGDPASGYKDSSTGQRLKAFETIMNLTHENLLEDQYNKIVQRARESEGVVGAALTAAAATSVDFDQHFSTAQTYLGDQLKMVAKLIAGRSPLGNERQIFFCSVGGYDNHSSLMSIHAHLMEELSSALMAFRNTLKDPALDVFDKVTTFTASDFSRTLTPNKNDATAGSDHAWGGHALIMGGGVKGRNLYGHYPPLKVGSAAGSIDSHTSRGRLIPDTSVDQYSAVLANWFGADSNSLEAIFPNLPRFDDPFASSSANLDFI